MSARDQFTLARQVGRALVDIGVDAVASPWGRALPLSPRAIANPDVFARLLGDGDEGFESLGRPASILATSIESPSSNCQNTIFELSGSQPVGGGPAPGSVFVKQSCTDFPTRLFANVIGFWKIECAFCRNLARSVPIEMPRVYAVAVQRSRFIIVMENLLTRPDTRLFVNRHLLEGVDLERARHGLKTLARLHAGFSGWSVEQRERGLPRALHPFLSPSIEPINLAVNRLVAGRCHKRAPAVFDEAGLALYRRALGRWQELKRAWYREPLTLVHGDSHLGNFFEAGDQMGMIDFQGAHWSQGIRDVQYFLINSMRPELLARHERELVHMYAEEITRLGTALDPETAWSQYRGFSFQTLMTAVVSRGLGSFTDSEDVIDAMLARSVAATQRLDFDGWLTALDR